jgi:amino acid transporter
VSIFSIMAPAAKVAGTGMLPALALASIPMIVFAVVYAFIGSTAPRSGASFERPARFIHQFAGVMVAWLRVVGNTGALTVLTLVLVSYVSRPVTLPQKPTRFMLPLAFWRCLRHCRSWCRCTWDRECGEVGGEIRNARAMIAKGLVSAVILTIVVSVAVSSIALGVFGAGRRREGRAAGRR